MILQFFKDLHWNGIFCFCRFDIMASFLFADCDVTNLEMEFTLHLGFANATTFLNFFDKYLLFLSCEDLQFVSKISFLFSLYFWALSVDKGVCITDGGDEKLSPLRSLRFLFLLFSNLVSFDVLAFLFVFLLINFYGL